jgi:ABC-type bacteriocin/lantibiotic exporter with double-glycine peptidase domain
VLRVEPPARVILYDLEAEEHGEVSAQTLCARLGAKAEEVRSFVLVAPALPMEELGRGVGLEPPTPMARLWSLLWSERRDVGVVLIYAVAVGLLALATPLAMQAIVNSVSFGALLQPVIVLSAALLGCLLLGAALRALQVWVVELLERRIFARMVGDLAWRLPRVELRAFDQANGPELVNRYFDLFTLKKVSAWLLLEGLGIGLTTLLGMLVLAFYHPLLLAFDAVLLLALLFLGLVLGRGAGKTAIKESKSKYALAYWLEELARHRLVFRGPSGAEMAFQRADALTRGYLQTRSKHFKIVLRQHVGLLVLQALATTSLITVGGWLVVERQLTLGQLVAAELIVSVLTTSLAKIAQYLDDVYDLVAAVDKLGQLADLPLERQGGHIPASVGPARRGASLRLRDVSFGFFSDRPLLRGASLEVAAGERVVISGPEGSGKSVMMELIFGLREPWSGSIEVDGHDLRDWRLSSLRERVAVVRGPELFEGTILENLQLGRREVGMEALLEALRDVDLLDEIQALPQGLDTPLTSGAPQLSTSQAVRLSLARALAARPALLVVDEVLGKVSETTADFILSRITNHDRPWTLLLLSRDPQVRASCGRHVVLDTDGTLRADLNPLPRGGR